MNSSEIERYAQSISDVLNLNALHDIDMMTDSKLGTVLLEVNPRPSGSIAGLSANGGTCLNIRLHMLANLEIPIQKPCKKFL